ncbi:MAG: hypothetical protein M3134_01280 [Actinomycetota bacterium]|nr:hypothetical protein [Actinomycetota bacterium]
MPDTDLERLLECAWVYCERAWVPRVNSQRTRVGAAVQADDGTRYGGCNVQQRFHAHDVHAEVNALTTMVAEGRHRLVTLALASDVNDLSPCGSCLDWILQLGGDDCVVAWQSVRGGPVTTRRAGDMMPFHPPYTRVGHGAPAG